MTDGTFEPPEGLTEVAETLESRGHEAWAVGGAVRDQLVGRGRADWDLATDAHPSEVRAIFRRTVPVGIEHGTVGVIASDEVMYEVTTFRRDVETDGRHAVVAFAEEIEEDLSRRDFTINALAWRPATGELKDPFGGREDLARGRLRAVGDPSARFAEDHLRVLRGLRFAGRFRMEIEEETREALAEAVPRLGELSAERIREELVKLLADDRPSEALRLYAEFGALEEWYPEVDRVVREDPRWEVHLGAVDEVPPHRRLLRLARLLVPVGGDAEERAERARELMRRLRFSNAAIDRVAHLVRHYEPFVSPVDSDAQIREWLAEVGEVHVRDVVRLHAAAARATGGSERARFIVAAWRRAHEQLLGHPPLTVGELAVDGRDLMELGIEEGPVVGILLDELHAEVLENPELNRREPLLERARELVRMGGLDRLAGAGDGRPDPDGEPAGSGGG